MCEIFYVTIKRVKMIFACVTSLKLDKLFIAFAVDLDYYFNILAALEMNPSNELSAIRNLLEVEPKT